MHGDVLPSFKLLFDIEEKNSMAGKKRGFVIASTLALVTIILSACKTPYSQAPAATFTPFPQSNLFASSEPTSGLGPVEVLATGSAMAQLTTTPSTPSTAAAGVTPQVVTATNTPLIGINPSPTSTLAVSSGPSATSIPVGSRPQNYTLQEGEFPYCIARRFNVDPDELLSLSGLSAGVLYPPGTVLRIPQTGSFPGGRMLRTHPATYTVTQSDETVYGVACAFGDVDPALVAQANGISVNADLSVGQNLSIP
jgi:LysM repeat protein